MITFFVPGTPIPKQSTRVTTRGKPHGILDPRMRAWQEQVAWTAKQAMGGSNPLNGNVTATITFYFTDKRRRDLDNCSKGTLDGMRGIVFDDDCQVVELHLYKFITDEPGALVEVEGITNSKCHPQGREVRE